MEQKIFWFSQTWFLSKENLLNVRALRILRGVEK